MKFGVGLLDLFDGGIKVFLGRFGLTERLSSFL